MRFCEDTFPFLLEVDRGLQIRRLGPLMRRVLPHATPGMALCTLFKLRASHANLQDYSALRAWCRRGVVLDTVGSTPAVVFRGEWYPTEDSDTLLFLGWPWVLDSEELPGLGLSLSDFPAHTPLSDLLVLLRSNQNTLADSRELSERLRQSHHALRASHQKLKRLAHFDPLTQLPNRVLLADRLRQAMAHSQRRSTCIAVVYLDLDGFKPINDQYGHGVGDLLLTLLSQRLKDALREGDTLARMGGDEFVAVLGDLQRPEDSHPAIERMLHAVRQPLDLDAITVQVSASIGVTFSPQDPADADLLMRHADQAMYQAKQAGKNRWHAFDLAHDVAVATRHENQEAIRQGLQDNEFVLHYQPLVDLATGQVLGVEALVRWQRCGRGLLAPALFLPQIQGHPLALSLGEWVLQSAVQQLALWNAQGLALSVSVNLDPDHLQCAEFVCWLQTLLERFPEVRAQQLVLEVLESSAMPDMDKAQTVLRQCQALGVHCALDDFGTGYSSLVHLKQLGVDTLKIDRRFVIGMLDDADDHAIVQAVVSLAQAFGREVVAEGVESAEHARALLRLGCTRAQGFGIAHPMPAQDVEAWVHAYPLEPITTEFVRL